MELPDVELVAAKVHETWMETKRAMGIESRKSETGEERAGRVHGGQFSGGAGGIYSCLGCYGRASGGIPYAKRQVGFRKGGTINLMKTILSLILAAGMLAAGQQPITTGQQPTVPVQSRTAVKHKHRMPGVIKIVTWVGLHGPGGQVSRAVARVLW